MDTQWHASRQFSRRVFAEGESDPQLLRRMRESYEVWQLEPEQARARTEMTIALAHHAALTDRIATGMPPERAVTATATATAIDELLEALRARPAYEFFVGIPGDLDAQETELLLGLKKLANSQIGARHLQWMRHTVQARAALRRYAAAS